jgi:hypothetical protein
VAYGFLVHCIGNIEFDASNLQESTGHLSGGIIGNGDRIRTYYFTFPVVLVLSRLVSVVFVSTICYTNFRRLCFFASTHIRWAVESDGGVVSVEETFCLGNPCELSKRKLAGLSYSYSVS